MYMDNIVLKRVLLLCLYIATLVSALAFKAQESVIIVLHFVLLVAICAIHDRSVYVGLFALFIGLIMAGIECICIQQGIWSYHNVARMIPVWLPITWAIVSIFIIDVYKQLVIM